MHIISEELGDAEDTRAEAEKYAQKIQDLHLDAASEEKLLKECERLGKMAGNQAEISVIRSLSGYRQRACPGTPLPRMI